MKNCSKTLGGTKFRRPEVTATGAERAVVEPRGLETLWFNTGTLCNIECVRCYIESSPINDRLAYLTAGEVKRFLDEIVELDLRTQEIGFTGGEPFLNPHLLEMLAECLDRGFDVLILTNAMRPLMRPGVRRGLLGLLAAHGGRLHLRVSLDHYGRELHEAERGIGSWAAALDGLRWLAANGFRLSIAGRRGWREPEEAMRQGYQRLFAAEGLSLDAANPTDLVLFPEMDETVDVPEITVDCWEILGAEPSSVMCASSRMVLRRRDESVPAVVSCTLLPYDRQFELGPTLESALRPVRLNHPHCARFCVLGGASCGIPR